MHHSLGIYNSYRPLFLKYYIFQAKWTRLPLIGKLVRMVADLYSRKGHGAYLLTLDEANEIVDNSDGIALAECTCRTVFKNCEKSTNTELLLSLGNNVFAGENHHEGEQITKERAREILQQSHLDGLLHTIVKCGQDFYAICNCCSCCCVPLRLKKEYGIGQALVRHPNILEKVKVGQAAKV
ncbi:MAG: ferredoxin-like protein [Dehalococcoidales bacterium]|nr:ferredoxin-like protein [Dehalococcoidales bacterium]